MFEVLIGSLCPISSSLSLMEDCIEKLPSMILLPLSLISCSGGGTMEDQIFRRLSNHNFDI